MAKKKDAPIDPLSPKQRRFVTAYISNGRDATKAYIKAGYSKNGAAQSAARLLKNAKIAEELSRVAVAAIKETEATQEWVLNQWMAVAKGTVADVLEIDDLGAAKLKKLDSLSSEQLALISSVKMGEGGFPAEVKLNDRLKALDALSKITGLYEKDNKQRNPGGADEDIGEIGDARIINVARRFGWLLKQAARAQAEDLEDAE